MKIDHTDKVILEELQDNARITNSELSKRVRLSLTATKTGCCLIDYFARTAAENEISFLGNTPAAMETMRELLLCVGSAPSRFNP